MLWSVGGALDFELGGTQFHIPGFLVIAAFIYAMFGTGSMLIIGRSFVRVSEVQNQREAEFRYALTRLRENGESIALLGGEKEERAGLTRNFWAAARKLAHGHGPVDAHDLRLVDQRASSRACCRSCCARRNSSPAT